MGFFTKKNKEGATKAMAPPQPTIAETIEPISQTNEVTHNDKATPAPSKRSIGSLFMGDRVIWVVYFFLCVISLVEVYSAASTLAYKS